VPVTEGTLSPSDEAELKAIVADAAGQGTPLAVVGGGTRSGLGRPMQTAATLSTANLTGVTLYEPTELVLSARAGTPLAEVQKRCSPTTASASPSSRRIIAGSTEPRASRRSAPLPPPIFPARAASRPAPPATA
jgi:FAD/FMN-containing dehydrogenase